MPSGGARPGSGPKPKPKANLPQIEYLESVTPQQRTWAIILLDKLENPKGCDEQYVAGWRELWDAKDLRIRLDTRRYIYDQAYGRAAERKEITGKDGKPIQLEHVRIDPSKLTDSQLAEAERLIESAFFGEDPR